jgi:hypothetical protein
MSGSGRGSSARTVWFAVAFMNKFRRDSFCFPHLCSAPRLVCVIWQIYKFNYFNKLSRILLFRIIALSSNSSSSSRQASSKDNNFIRRGGGFANVPIKTSHE